MDPRPPDHLVIAVVRAHGVPPAAEWSGLSDVAVRATAARFGINAGRGHPSREEMERRKYRDTCTCPSCRGVRAERERLATLARAPKCSACGKAIAADKDRRVVHIATGDRWCADGFELGRPFTHDLNRLGVTEQTADSMGGIR